ncbi:MAG: type II toxin-antitoxin system HicB family antitoxin [Dongiaceae bacterium]
MRHYIAILVETDVGEWRVLFPDVPGCEAKGFNLDDARFAAQSALRQCIEDSNTPPPMPMDMLAVERNEDWLKRHHVDLSTAVVTMIPVAA